MKSNADLYVPVLSEIMEDEGGSNRDIECFFGVMLASDVMPVADTDHSLPPDFGCLKRDFVSSDGDKMVGCDDAEVIAEVDALIKEMKGGYDGK